MKKVKILYFKDKHQDRISFVRLLAKYNNSVGLKKAKILQDRMLDGIPILYEIEENKLTQFLSCLDKLKLEYTLLPKRTVSSII